MFVLLLLGCLLQNGTALAADAPSVENQVKSAFIINFIQFTEWPEGTFSKSDDPIVIGVIGPDAMEAALSTAIAGKTIHARKLVVKHMTASTLSGCHVLYIGSAYQDQAPAILKALEGARTLTIGDKESFIDAGGIIRFYLEDRKVRFEINQAAAERLRLQISAKLLKLARVVNK
jgi:hypothetical protein